MTPSAYNFLARKRWWEESKDKLSKCLFDELKGIADDRREMRDLMLTYFRAYSLQQANRLVGLGTVPIAENFSKLRMNVIKSVIDTAGAHIGTNKTRPFFLTTKGTRRNRENALTLNRMMLGLFYAGQHYEIAPKVFEGGSIFGLGSELIQPTKSGRIKYDRVIPLEQYWDPAEALLGPPRNRYIVKEISKYELEHWAMCYGEKLKQPGGCELVERLWTQMTDQDSCSLVFAWHLASEDGESDGRHVVACSNQIFFDAPYDRTKPPMVDFHIQRPQVGWVGDSYASELLPFQIEINYIIQKQQALINLATTQLWVKKGEGLGKVDNRNMAVREFKNQPPIVLPVTPYAREFNEWREMVFNKAFQIVGLSQLAAQALKPAGLDSGQAIRTYKDVTSRRLQEVDQNWDQHHVAVAEETLNVCRDMIKLGWAPKSALAMGDRYVEKLPFDQLTKMERNNYVIRPYPTSMLPVEPAGQIQMAQDLMRISPEFGPTVIGLMAGIPDIEAAVDRMQAPYDLADFHLGEMLDNRKQYMPNSNMDLSYARIQVERAICQAEKEDADVGVIDKLARYQSEIDRLQLLQQSAAPPPGMGQTGAGPGGMPPMPPPGPGMLPGPPGSGPGGPVPGMMMSNNPMMS